MISFKTTYPNIDISALCCRSANSQFLTGFLKYLRISVAHLALQMWRRNLLFYNPYPAILRRKNLF